MVLLATLMFGIVVPVAAAPHANAKGGGGPEAWATQCGATTYRLIFWPEGHPPFRAGEYRYPAYTTPYVLLYKGTGRAYSVAQFAVFLDSVRRESTSRSCHPVAIPATTKTITNRRRTRDAATLTCTFHTEPLILVTTLPTASGYTLTLSLVDTTHTAAAATLASKITLDYTTATCKPTKAPA